MNAAAALARVSIKNILYLTDFSEASESALPFAMSFAREYGSAVHALHILMPPPYVYATPESSAAGLAALEDGAVEGMKQIDAQLAGLPHDTAIERDVMIMPRLQRAIRDWHVDLVVLGTRGRTGAQKLMLGSVAEEIFRQSPVPVLTIGPRTQNQPHNAARFHRVMFATDFSPESMAAAPYAISIAQENQAVLLLLHVVKDHDKGGAWNRKEASVAHALGNLHEIVPPDAELWCRPETLVKFGNPAVQILETAEGRGIDLIVMGVKNAAGHLGAATHLERATAHQIVSHAACPVLTVRG